jgi:hypothetical protein
MSTNSSDRAEARRRARLAARGELPPEEPVDVEEEASSRGGFLGRIFPAAPPLPGMPDPLAGFDHSGPLRPVRERFFLLRQSPLIWILGGIVVFFGVIAQRSWGTEIYGLIGTVALFGGLIAAGWYGWRRPTLYGVAAALLGWALASAFVLYWFAAQGAPPGVVVTGTSVATRLVIDALYQAGLGFLGGWYGGYLRRRQAQLSAQAGRRR